MIICGIDPGKSGCLFAIDSETRKTIAFHDIEKMGVDIDIAGIVNFLKQFNVDDTVIISEDPHPHGTDGIKTVYAGFEYGKSVGIIFGIINAMGFKFHKVSPPVWKGHFAITSSESTYQEKKELSVQKACYLSPESAGNFRTKFMSKTILKHDRAEACLIALYFLETKLIKKENKC